MIHQLGNGIEQNCKRSQMSYAFELKLKHLNTTQAKLWQLRLAYENNSFKTNCRCQVNIFLCYQKLFSNKLILFWTASLFFIHLSQLHFNSHNNITDFSIFSLTARRCGTEVENVTRRSRVEGSRPTVATGTGRENGDRGKYRCTVDLLFDLFGLVCFANKNKNCQMSYS